MQMHRQSRILGAPLVAFGAAAAVLASVAAAPSAEGGAGQGKPRPGQVVVSAEPQQLDVVGLPCFPGRLEATMTNTGEEDRFADMTLDADEPLTLSRGVFSSYLPAADPDQPVSAPVEVRVPRDTAPGAYEITLDAERDLLTVPVQVQPLPAKGPGDNLALGEQASASSTHGRFSVCGAVDGDADSENWSTSTGWNDGTRGAFPDTYDVQLATAVPVDRVELYTLDSTRYPASGFGLSDWDVQVRAGGTWQTVDEVRDNTVGHVTSTFAPVTADAVRIVGHGNNNNDYSRIVELEVYGN